jgi:pimeloyl-ACP methyl ester carboxylesterase
MRDRTELDQFAGLPPRRGEIQAGSIRLGYLEWGDRGRPLALLHGITSSARAWWRAAPTLAAQGCHVYALDMPGHGRSDESADHRIESIAGLIAAALRALDLQDVTLVGHSWGGATALALASMDEGQALLSRVALVDPALSMTPETGAARLPNYMVGVGDPPELTLPTVRANNPDWHEYDVFWKGEAFQQCRAAAVRGLFLGSGTWNLTDRFAQVDIPLLLLVADPQYTVIAPDTLAAAERSLRPGLGRMATIPGTTHNMLRGDGYAPTMQVLTAWLADKAIS